MLLEKTGKKGGMKPVLRASTALVFHWTCSFHPFSVAIEGQFLRSVAHILVASFRTKIENCLRGKSRSGIWSVVVIGPVSPIIDLPRAKSVRGASSSSYGHAACLNPPLALSKGRPEEG